MKNASEKASFRTTPLRVKGRQGGDKEKGSADVVNHTKKKSFAEAKQSVRTTQQITQKETAFRQPRIMESAETMRVRTSETLAGKLKAFVQYS